MMGDRVGAYGESELDHGSTVRNFRIVQTQGHRKVSGAIAHCSLEAPALPISGAGSVSLCFAGNCESRDISCVIENLL